MKRAMVGVVAAGLLFAGAGAALASAQEGSIPKLETRGVEFLEGRYKFNPPGVNHGSFEWSGLLRDAIASDGHNVYVQVRVEGHGWARYYGKQRRTVRMHHSDWSGAQRYTDDASIRVCRDRGSLRPDNCSPTQKFAYRRD
ncbi:hypothetical protein F9278_13510 [Streptomyces phaeolivaceus]|uniref:Beta/gamma crystallin family protein n=1 Tax=Streptomyces phaeolivaceus TaxID=2653200 RepID=A0A5P8K252_9ACTN|nr:hypothetical protein [Streptomyces phaeolivaceus]QFQ97060.1 hypothetical protein F9278_13510 [Streptomyces phaeolivaceus]